MSNHEAFNIINPQGVIVETATTHQEALNVATYMTRTRKVQHRVVPATNQEA